MLLSVLAAGGASEEIYVLKVCCVHILIALGAVLDNTGIPGSSTKERTIPFPPTPPESSNTGSISRHACTQRLTDYAADPWQQQLFS